MPLRTARTKKQTVPTGDTTDSYTFDDDNSIKGKIREIRIVVSASSDFKIYEKQPDGNVMKYLLGSSGTAKTVASDSTFPIRTTAVDTAGDDLTYDGTNKVVALFVVDGAIQIDVSNVTGDDTWSVEIVYEV